MTPNHLARQALARLPRPYTDEVTLHVFCEIERTPHLRRSYDALIDGRGYTQDGLNTQIGKAVKDTLGAEPTGQFDAEDACEIVRWPSRLRDIKSDWR